MAEQGTHKSLDRKRCADRHFTLDAREREAVTYRLKAVDSDRSESAISRGSGRPPALGGEQPRGARGKGGAYSTGAKQEAAGSDPALPNIAHLVLKLRPS